MADGFIGLVRAFGWGLICASGVVAGTVLGLVSRLSHRSISAIMSFGAGMLLSAASVKIVSESLITTSAGFVGGGIIAGAAIFSAANAALESARHRKRCGECEAQPSESEVPGSGMSIALGTALDAIPEALVLGITLRTSGPDVALIVALALSNVPEALSGTAGMRLASRTTSYILRLWGGIALGTAATTALAFLFLGDLGPQTASILKVVGAGALLGMAVETMIPEAFHNGPRFSGVLAAVGFAALILFGAAWK